MQFLLRLPVPVSIIIVLAVSIGLSVLGLRFVRKRYPQEALKENHEVAGFVYNAFMLIYAVLVAFVVYVTWSNYDETKKNAEMEANLIVDVFSDAQGLPDTMRVNSRSAFSEYVRLIIDEEWSAMERGTFSPDAGNAFRKIWGIYFNTDVSKIINQEAYKESLNRLNKLGEYRRMRIIASKSHMPGLIWLVLIVCAVTSVGYTYFFGTKNLRAQYVMTSVLALINGLILYLIFVLDHPFNGNTKITGTVFIEIQRLIDHVM